MRLALRLALFSCLLLAAGLPASAETGEVRITRQPGVLYVPLVLMEANKLIEKQVKAAGLADVKVSWVMFNSGGAATDALLSGNVDFVVSGATNMLLMWDKTKGQVKGVAAVGGMPMYLLTRNPEVKSLKDFTEKNKIAVPTLKVSSQAVVLQMAAEQAFGATGYSKLDTITIQLGHPDAMAAVLSNAGEIDSHFSLPPYQQIELRDARVHKVLSSNEVFGGPFNNAVMYGNEKFRSANPKVMAAVVAALGEAHAMLKADPKAAAETYLAQFKEKVTADELVAMLKEPGAAFDTAPVGLDKLSAFMAKTGTIKTTPASWKDFFFPEAHAMNGN